MTITNNIISIEYDSIDNLELPFESICELKIKFGDVLYEFVINLKQNSDKMIVLGSSSIPYEYLDYWDGKPYYNRWKWDFTESFICYNDPTRYLGKRIPGLWGIGTEDNYYLKNIKNIILKITSKFNISNENILFFGSSMGGFMSLLLSTMVKGSKAIADIPQLDLENYREGNWYNIKKFCFKNLSDEYIKELGVSVKFY